MAFNPTYYEFIGMNGIVITWQQLLYISLVLILFYAAELLLFLRKSSQQRPDDASLRRALSEQREQIADLRREIESLKVRLAAVLAPGVEAADDDASRRQNAAYSQAIQLAQSGADADKVCAECGISRGEADLIVALYRTGTLR